MTMDILTMTESSNTGMNRDATALRRLSEIAGVFTSNQTAPAATPHQRNNSSISDALRSNKRNSLSLSNFPALNAASSTPSSAIRASTMMQNNTANNNNPFKRQKLEQSTTNNSNPMSRMLLLQQQQRQLQQQIQFDHYQQHQQQQQQNNSGGDDDNHSGGGDEAASHDGLTSGVEDNTDEAEGGVRFREYQAEIWSEKFEELCIFRRQQGHCHVPHHYTENQGLAQWVKRQRYQYKLRLDGKRSTLSDERVRLLNKIGFIWNSHDAVWEERLQDLMLFKQIHGHCMVPSNFEPNVQLAIWIKRQRRQYKKYTAGQASSMTTERIARLEAIGFVWDCRKQNKQQQREQQDGVLAAMSKNNNNNNNPNNAAMMAQQQHQRQLIMMQMQLINQQQAARAQAAGVDAEGPDANNAASAKKEETVAQEKEQTTTDHSEGEAASVVRKSSSQPQEEKQELPARMPKCEFFSFSRKFKY